jgi:hypothetical protein
VPSRWSACPRRGIDAGTGDDVVALVPTTGFEERAIGAAASVPTGLTMPTSRLPDSTGVGVDRRRWHDHVG